MKLKVFRIADSRHPIFDSTGAFLNPARWHSRGNRVIYAASTYAGALLEQLAHANIGKIPKTQAYIEIEIPGGVAIEYVLPGDVPGWQLADMLASRERGDVWYKAGSTAVLIVPSAVTLGVESNVLINQAHPDFARITASEPREVQWDPRLLRE